MSMMAPQITDVSTVCPCRLFWRRSKKTSKLRVIAFVRAIHRSPVDSPHKGPVTREMFPWRHRDMFSLELLWLSWFLITFERPYDLIQNGRWDLEKSRGNLRVYLGIVQCLRVKLRKIYLLTSRGTLWPVYLLVYQTKQKSQLQDRFVFVGISLDLHIFGRGCPYGSSVLVSLVLQDTLKLKDHQDDNLIVAKDVGECQSDKLQRLNQCVVVTISPFRCVTVLGCVEHISLKTESYYDANFVVIGGGTSDDKVGAMTSLYRMIILGSTVAVLTRCEVKTQPHYKNL